MITIHRKRHKTMQSGMPHFGATLGAPKEQLDFGPEALN